MSRRRVIVGLGEALLVEHADREEPGGLALLVPQYAVLLGHEGIAISRLGQDEAARQIIGKLREAGVDTSHLQSDPDLATARLLRRSLGGRNSLVDQAAFDSLQWDFDLADVAQRADAVVFGALAGRSGQARSAIDRFLDECAIALRLFDLTCRHGDELNRSRVISGLKHSDVLVVDNAALDTLLPGAAGKPPREAALEWLRTGELDLVLFAQEGQPLAAHTSASSWTGDAAHHPDAHEASIVGFLHGMLSGWEVPAALRLAEGLGRHARDHRGEPPPPELLEGA